MSREKVRGLAASNALLDRLAPAARHELLDLLGPIGRDIQARQEQLVAKKTGYLGEGLKSRLDAVKLRVLVGLFGIGAGRGRSLSRTSRFYGRIIEGGRAAQTVLVTRHLKRRVKGNGRYGTKRRVIYEGKPYKMKVRAMTARPFIRPPGARDIADRRLADFWARTFAQAGVGS